MQPLPVPHWYGYQPIVGRPRARWEGERGLAVYVAINVEHFGYGRNAQGEPDVLGWGLHDYGNRVGVWRLLQMFDELDIPTAALVNASVYDYAPDIPAAFRSRGDEIVGHGATNSERLGAMDEETERRRLAEVTEVLTEAEGRPPAGWLSPFLSESDHTPDLLAGLGYRYVMDWRMDDQPVQLRTSAGSGSLVALPYARELVDKIAVEMRHVTAGEYADMVVDTFDEMLEQAEDQRLVMSISLHPYVVGQPHRLRHLRRALRHVLRSRDQIWLTTPERIAAASVDEAVA